MAYYTVTISPAVSVWERPDVDGKNVLKCDDFGEVYTVSNEKTAKKYKQYMKIRVISSILNIQMEILQRQNIVKL